MSSKSGSIGRMVLAGVLTVSAIILGLRTAYLQGASEVIAPTINIVKELPRDDDFTSLDRGKGGADVQTIETELLPLRMVTRHISAQSGIAPGGGAIEPVGNQLLILDRFGGLFAYRAGITKSLPQFSLPLHLEAFRHSGPLPFTEEMLRAHDIKYDTQGKALYASYDSYDENSRTLHFVVSRLTASPDLQRMGDSWQVLFQSPPLPITTIYAGREAGGKLLISGESLYVTVGDYGFYRQRRSVKDVVAQNRESFFGKIYKYDLRRGSLTMISMGHRVSEGLAMTSDGKLIATENGPRGGDALNVIVQGANYGWPYFNYGTQYSSYTATYPSAPPGFNERIEPPLFVWSPSIAPTAIAQAHAFHSRWDGDLILGTLKAQSLIRVKVLDGRVILTEAIWIGHRIRDLAEMDGKFILWTDDGCLVTIAPDVDLLATGQLNSGRAYQEQILGGCTSCHSFAAHNQFNWAPSLNGIFGAPIGKSRFENYSAAMKATSGVWDEGSLTAFLLNPQSFIPGTTMVNIDSDAKHVAEIVRVLKSLSAASSE